MKTLIMIYTGKAKDFKIKKIATESVELLNYIESLTEQKIDEKSKEIAKNKDIDELLNIIKEIML